MTLPCSAHGFAGSYGAHGQRAESRPEHPVELPRYAAAVASRHCRRARKPIDRLTVTDLSADRVRQFLNELEEKRGCSISTRNQRLAAIHALARFIGQHAPELVEWCGQVRTVPFKKAPQRSGHLLGKAGDGCLARGAGQ